MTTWVEVFSSLRENYTGSITFKDLYLKYFGKIVHLCLTSYRIK